MTVLWTFPSEVKFGIRIVSTLLQTRARFSNAAGEALDLIARVDPVRFERVRAQIRTVGDGSGIVVATYVPALKLCGVNIRSFEQPNDPEGTVRFLASILVYEATFGYLLRSWALRTQANRDRFDRLSRREAQRFMRRLGMARTPWDEENPTLLSPGELLRIGLADTIAAQRKTGRL